MYMTNEAEQIVDYLQMHGFIINGQEIQFINLCVKKAYTQGRIDGGREVKAIVEEVFVGGAK